MAGITAITRDWGDSVPLVRLVTTDTLGTLTTAGYLLTQAANIDAANSGPFTWTAQDFVLCNFNSGANWDFFTYIPSTGSLSQFTPAGGVSSTLPSGDILVGNGSNVATAVAMSGAATISNAGVVTLANNTVDFANLALDVLQTASVSLTAAQIKGMYAAPVSLLSAPGANKLIVVDSIMWDVAYGTTQFAAGGAIAAQYGSTVDGGGPAARNTIAAATLNGVTANTILTDTGVGLNVARASCANTAVYLSNATAAFTTGDSTATLYIRYHIVTIA